MTVYSVVAAADPGIMDSAIQTHYTAIDYFKIKDGVWLVASPLPTPKDLGVQLVPNNESGTFIITSISGYYGFYNPGLWDWLKAKGL